MNPVVILPASTRNLITLEAYPERLVVSDGRTAHYLFRTSELAAIFTEFSGYFGSDGQVLDEMNDVVSVARVSMAAITVFPLVATTVTHAQVVYALQASERGGRADHGLMLLFAKDIGGAVKRPTLELLRRHVLASFHAVVRRDPNPLVGLGRDFAQFGRDAVDRDSGFSIRPSAVDADESADTRKGHRNGLYRSKGSTAPTLADGLDDQVKQKLISAFK